MNILFTIFTLLNYKRIKICKICIIIIIINKFPYTYFYIYISNENCGF